MCSVSENEEGNWEERKERERERVKEGGRKRKKGQRERGRRESEVGGRDGENKIYKICELNLQIILIFQSS